MSHRLTVTILLLITLAGGCAPDTEPEQIVEPAPLPMDPTAPLELSEWWSDGGRLLHLEDDGQFTLWSGLNRYRDQRQLGRWSRGSYAVLWLEPYDTRQPERVRVAINRAPGGGPMLSIPGGPPLRPIEQPAEVLEDRLVGTWQAAQGTVTLESSGRYTYRAGSDDASGHQGHWSIQKDQVMLQPGLPGMKPFLLRVIETEEAIRLEGPEVQFEKREEAAGNRQ